MKKILLFLLLAGHCATFAQTLLGTHKLDLKRPTGSQEILTVTDTTYSQLAVFAADKETLSAFRLNSAVFFTDSLYTQRPSAEYDHMAGYSFHGSSTCVYWADEELKKIQCVYFDFGSKTVARKVFDMPYEKNEDIVSSFSEYNSFYIVTLHPSRDILKFYIFNEGNYEVKTADFSAFSFVTETNKKTTLHQLLSLYPLQKIEAKTFNDLLIAGNKMKLYALPNEFLFTMDHNPAITQVFRINANTFSITGRTIPQPVFEEDADANSYYLDGVLYRVKLNSDEIMLSALSLNPDREIKNYHATKDEAIGFKNSPLLSQTENDIPSEVDTKKFLRRGGGGGASITAYRTPDDIRIMAGSVRYITTASFIGPGIMSDSQELQTNYFEALFDDRFEHRPYRLEMLAADNIGMFISGNKRVSLQTVIPFKGYYILSYYDAIAKRYVMRKFEDNYVY